MRDQMKVREWLAVRYASHVRDRMNIMHISLISSSANLRY